MIAVTGANGLLGSFIVRKLIEQKKQFIAIKRKNSDTSLLKDVASFIAWRDADILDPVALEEALQGVTTVIHAAAMVSFNPAHKKKIVDINVVGTRHVVNICLANKIKRLIHISSVAALGRQKGQEVIDEESKWANSPLNSNYGESKYFAELEVFRGQEEGLSTVILNPSVILAPANWDKSSAQLFKYVWKESKVYIDSSLNYVDVRDVVEATYQLIDSPVHSTRFIVNGGTIPFIDFFKMVATQFNKKPPFIKVNKTLLRVVALVEKFKTQFTNAEPLITRETAHMAGTHFYYDNKKIKKILNIDFQSITNTIQWCTKYYRSED
jgi:dihydroflavonol-4-reductase